MSTRVTVSVGFYFEKEHYAQLHAYLPRTEALKIPQLNCQENQNYPEPEPEARSAKPSKQAISDSKKASDEDISEEDDNENINDMEIENEDEEENQIDQEQQQEVQDVLQQLEDEQAAESQSSSDSYDSDREDEGDEIDSEILSSPSPTRNFLKNQTKRQKGEIKDLIQLPDRRPRKNKNVDEATEVIRREQKERKRKQYLKKQIQAQEKATIDKLLNETGRKLKQREEKEMQDELEREQKIYKTLGDTPKIITLIADNGKTIMTHKTSLFPKYMTTSHDVKMKEICSHCGNVSKYRLKGCNKFACSLPCYKVLTV